MRARAKRQRAASASAHFSALPPELQLLIAKQLHAPWDCAALCVAHPRLGLWALQSIAFYKDPLVSIAMKLSWVPGFSIDESLLRRYAADERANVEGCKWLAAANRRRRREGLRLCIVEDGVLQARGWQLYDGDRKGPIVRVDREDIGSASFAGKRGAERMTCLRGLDGTVAHYEGEKGSEHKVCEKDVDGAVMYYEGEKGAERMLRLELETGLVVHYEGEKGAERVVRREASQPVDNRTMTWTRYYAGTAGEERLVRVELQDCDCCSVAFFEGGMDAERMVRLESKGAVCHFEGKGDEMRVVRVQASCGEVTTPGVSLAGFHQGLPLPAAITKVFSV